MVFKFGLLLLAAYISTTSALPPCVCTRNYLPVCGSDGQTYANECLLNCRRSKNSDVTLVKEGRCDADIPTCICTFEYNPVCGSDGKTYPNKCALNCDKAKSLNLEVKYQGECQKEEVKIAYIPMPSCTCTRQFNEVCGTDGVTYSNPCLLNCASEQSGNNIHIDHEGACDGLKVKVVEQPNDDSKVKVIESNDDSDDSKVKVIEANDDSKVKVIEANDDSKVKVIEANDDSKVKVVEQPDDDSKVKVVESNDDYKVKVVEQPSYVPPCVCTRDLKPVCGSDGVTYNNLCLLRCAGKAVRVARYGPC